MDEKEIEAIRRKKMMQLQQNSQEDVLRQQQQEEMREEQKVKTQAMLKVILDGEARERLSRLSLIKPEIVESIQNQLIQAYQQGQLPVPITDEQLKMLISRIMPPKREINIKRRHYE